MKDELNILLVEDNSMDVGLLKRTLILEFKNLHFCVIQTEKEFLLEIEKDYDLVISDYALPRFNGKEALRLRNKINPLIPFIIVTGSMNEETAVECMKAGADDYVIKEHIKRLAQAVKRAITQKQMEREQIAAQGRVKTLNRLLVILRRLNQLIITEKDIKLLLENVCDIVLEEGMGKAIWIGYYYGRESRDWMWVQRGYGIDYFEKVKVYWSKNSVPVCGKTTLESGDVAIIHRSKKECGNCPFLNTFPDQHQITLPLKYQDVFYGVVSILVPDRIALSIDEINLLQEAASDLSYAINHILTEQEKVHTARIRSLIYDISQAALTTEDLNHLLAKVHQILGDHLNVSNFYVALYRPDTDTYDFPYFKDVHDKAQSFKGVETRQGVTEYVRRTAKPLLATIDMQDRLVAEKQIKKVGHPSQVWMGVPLATKNGVIGVMALQNYEDVHAFSPDDLELLTFISGQVAMSIEKRDLMDHIAESEAQFRAAFMVSPDSITISRLSDGKYVLVNKKFQELTGYPEEQILGKTSYELKLWVNKKDRNDFAQKLREKNTLNNYETVFKNNRGKKANVLIASRVINLAGEPHILSITRDITDRKRTEEEIRLLSRTVEQNPLSVIVTDVDGTITYVNKKFSEVSGFSRQEVIGQNPRILKSGQMADDLYKDLWDTISKGMEWQGEMVNKKKNGNLFWELVSISPVLNDHGKVTHFVAIKEDISERKIVEEQLRLAKEKAEESNQLKSEFLANLSHEIRTPMNGIIGFASLLEEDEDQSPDTRSNYIRIIINSTQQLLRIITDILEISKLETHQVPLNEREVNLNSILMEIFSIFDLRAKEKKLSLHLKKGLNDRAAVVLIDDSKLHKILDNLLENALKFTNKGYVELGYQLRGNLLEFYVKDTGIGIRPEMKEIIFERFSQEEKELSRKVGGLGLGLSIAKANAELMGGSIKVGSEKGKGSTFYIRIPYKPVYPDALSEERIKKNKTAEENDGCTFLVVEDDEVNYQYLEILLKKMNQGFNILHAINGEEAVGFCKDNLNICMVFMDIKMQGMSGLEATRILKKLNPTLPVIAQSAFVSSKDQQRAYEAGCDTFISKPISADDFYAVIESFLNKQP